MCGINVATFILTVANVYRRRYVLRMQQTFDLKEIKAAKTNFSQKSSEYFFKTIACIKATKSPFNKYLSVESSFLQLKEFYFVLKYFTRKCFI